MTDTTTKVREHYSGIGLADSHQGGHCLRSCPATTILLRSKQFARRT